VAATAAAAGRPPAGGGVEGPRQEATDREQAGSKQVAGWKQAWQGSAGLGLEKLCSSSPPVICCGPHLRLALCHCCVRHSRLLLQHAVALLQAVSGRHAVDEG